MRQSENLRLRLRSLTATGCNAAKFEGMQAPLTWNRSQAMIVQRRRRRIVLESSYKGCSTIRQPGEQLIVVVSAVHDDNAVWRQLSDDRLGMLYVVDATLCHIDDFGKLQLVV